MSQASTPLLPTFKFPGPVLLPKHFHQRWDATRLKDGQQALAMVREVVQSPSGTASCFYIICILHSAYNGRHHLRRAHDGMSGSFLLGKLMNHDSSLINYHLEQG